MNSNLIQGKCACGGVQYELTTSPMFVHCCHCTWCQRETGSAFAINALIETNHIRLVKGCLETIHTPSSSGIGQDIHRCSSCKTAVWSNYGAAKEAVSFVRVGTLTNPDSYPPDIHIFTSSRQQWVKLDNSIPVMAEYYQRSKYWPEESIARYRHAINA